MRKYLCRIVNNVTAAPGGEIEPFDLIYSIVQTENPENFSAGVKVTFGIEILKRRKNIDLESNAIEDIYVSLVEAEKMACLLADNTVTPVGLPYIIEDTLGL